MTFIPLISNTNSTDIPLIANSTYVGISELVSDYNSVIVSVFSDQDSADIGLYIEFSSNNINWDFQTTTKIYASSAYKNTVPTMARYVRIRYINGNITQTSFRLQTILSNNQTMAESIGVSDTQKLLTFINTQLVGKNVDTDLHKVNKVKSDSEGNLLVKINNPLSGFGNLKVSNEFTQDTLSFLYNINDALVNSTILNSGNITHSNNKAIVASGSTSGSSAILISVTPVNYIPSTSVIIKFASVFSNPVNGTRMFIGFGNDDNGFFMAYNETIFSICHRSNNVNTFISQSDWNLDSLDGNGPSNIVINPQLGNIYQIVYQWFGYGAINFFIENPNTGQFYKFHQIKYTNTNLLTSIQNPNGFLRIETYNDTSTDNVEIQTPSMAVGYENEPNKHIGLRFAISNTASIARNNIETILSIRNKSIFQTVTNFIPVNLNLLSISANGNRNVRIDLLLNQTTANLNYTDISTNQSVMEFSNTVTEITDGKLVQSFYLASTDSLTLNLSTINLVLYPGQSLTFAAFTNNNTNENSVSISWIEHF